MGGFTRLYMEEDGFGILEAVPAEHADVGLWAMNQRLEARARLLNHPGWVPNDTPAYRLGPNRDDLTDAPGPQASGSSPKDQRQHVQQELPPKSQNRPLPCKAE